MPSRPALALFAAMAAVSCSRAATGDQPRVEYDKVTGRLTRLEFDANKNGKNDGVSYMDGTRVVRIELDLDENGKVERWDFYTPDGSLEKVGLSGLNDGVMDAQTFYNTDRTIQRIEISTKRDGRFDKTEFYEQGGLVRSEEDVNGDGRADKWETYRPIARAGPNEPAYGITSTTFDDTGSGHPERRFLYGPGGAITSVEVDPDGDGVFQPQQTSTPSTFRSRARSK